MTNPLENSFINKEFCENSKNLDNLKSSEFIALFNKREAEIFKPIYFNVMVVGAKSLGKSTYIEALLEKKFFCSENIKPATKEIVEYAALREEGKIKFYLKLIDTPGYHNKDDIPAWYKNIKNYIKDKFLKVKKNESEILNNFKLGQKIFKLIEIDDNIHVIIYFLSGPRIKKNDVIIMKKLQKYANIIPVIAKGDCYTFDEIKEIKLNIIKQAEENNLIWFDCIEPLKEYPEKLKIINEGPFGPSPPFLLIASIDKIELNDHRKVFGRAYNWGICNIENPNHCDFILFYNLLIGHYSLELIRITKEIIYFNFIERMRKKNKVEKLKQSRQIKFVGLASFFVLSGSLIFFFKKKELS